ncbi:hypothetical protein NDU88_001216 [Pleurodeles waltl]|uniref:Uncharacterized protein n=1 Tax=Pleurodeles waltl TaxID=8319 RepID=A0AAV7SYQ5_PLEWA|nr:hypothetical protein NDU88_001216 [Pleurodeles waltl]
MRLRLSKITLLVERDCGGLGLPSVEHYALGLQLSQLAFLLLGKPDPPLWVQTERALLNESEGLGVLYGTTASMSQSAHPVVQDMLHSRSRAHFLLGINPQIHTHVPLWGNTGLQIGRQMIDWVGWQTRGIFTVNHLLENGLLKTFLALRAEYSLPAHYFWQYQQLSHCILSRMGFHPLTLIHSLVIDYWRTWGSLHGVM